MIPDFLSSSEKNDIMKKLEDYGIKKLPFLLIKSGKDKLRAYSGNLSREELAVLTSNVFTEVVGLYFAKKDGEDIRLSIDAIQLLKEQIKNNILELDEKQFEQYLKGNDIPASEKQIKETNDKKIYFVLKHRDDLLGMAKISQGQIKNYLPKERRRKS